MNKITKNNTVLKCKKVKFYGHFDKEIFFGGLRKIKNIINVIGEKDSIYLTVSSKIQDDEILAIISLFRRYNIKLDQLDTFLNETNKDWFHAAQKGYSTCIYPSKK